MIVSLTVSLQESKPDGLESALKHAAERGTHTP
jgi:hypothetical protein